MLVLSRKEGEEIVVNERLTIRIVKIKGSGCRLAFDGPATDVIRRAELPSFELPPAINDTIEQSAVAIGLPQ
jgi:carbon storage regulator CsrA